MKKKIVWLVASSLMVLALVAAACAPAPKEEVTPAKEAAPVVKEVAPKKEVAPAVAEKAPAEEKEMVKVTLTKADGTVMERLVEKPKYGGTLLFSRITTILAWDEAIQAPWTLSPSLAHTNQDLLMGDWARGPAGTNEYAWQVGDWGSLNNVAGELAESWEFADDQTVIYHIRKGVKWHDKPPLNGREFTADDVVFNLKRIYFDIPTSTMYGMLGYSRPTEVYAKDKYTVVMKTPKGLLGKTFEEVSELTKMVPPEVVKKYGDHNKWENVTGTGPFLLVDYVPMSSATWVRNPNYWQYDPVLGKDYPLPYVDRLKALIIPDVSTEMAALRTGKVDWSESRFSQDEALPLLKSNPALQHKRNDVWICRPMGLGRMDKPELPTQDLRVRRALLMGINFQEISDKYYGGGAEILNYKVPPASEFKALGWYTPVEELPPSTRELYEYHPEKAKQLLAEAGYPDGFKMEVVVGSTPLYFYLDHGQMLQAYWQKIGVDLKLDVKEFGTFMSIYQRKAHKDSLWCGRGSMVTSMYMCRKGNMYNWAMIDDPKIEKYYDDITGAYFDEPKRNKLMKEMNLYVLSQAWQYAPPSPYTYLIWQPWLKNYRGESAVGFYSGGQYYRYLWLDPELKKALGY